jgi:hypothetical protein
MTPATGVTDALPVPEPLQRREPARHLTADEVQKIHGVPASTVRSWAYRCRIFAVGIIPGTHGGRDSPVYDERKLEPLIKAWQARRRRTDPDP